MNTDVLADDFAPIDITFSLFAPGAYTVSVVIFFNELLGNFSSPSETDDGGNLNPKDQVMVRDLVRLSEVRPGRWHCEVELPPGWYEYLFLVDCEWMLDPDASMICPDGAGGFNSARLVAPDTLFDQFSSPTSGSGNEHFFPPQRREQP